MTPSLPNPLHALHEQSQAELQPYADLEIVSTFGLPQVEYAAIRRGAGLMDLPQRGLLQLTGKDRLPFLNNLLSNQTWDKVSKTGLAPRTGIYAFYLNVKGRIVAEMNVLELGDRSWLEMDARMVEPLRAALDRYLFAEQVKIESLVNTVHRIALHGPDAWAALGQFADAPLPELERLGSAQAKVLGVELTIFRDDPCGVPGLQIALPAADAPVFWSTLVDRFANLSEPGKRRAHRVGWAAFNACRIEAGTPLFDIDFGNSADVEKSTLPAETGPLFERAVSLVKGCYLGQEIVARMHARQQLARKLVGLRMEGDALPIAGTTIYDDQNNPIGMITSSTVSPVLSNAAIALGYLKKPYFDPGKRVTVPAEGAMHQALVTALPFVN